MTHYIILYESQETKNVWAQITSVEARSARAAIAKAMEGENNPYQSGGTFIAVPLRSWRPVTVAVETKTALKFS